MPDQGHVCKFGRRNSCRIRDTGVNLGGTIHVGSGTPV